MSKITKSEFKIISEALIFLLDVCEFEELTDEILNKVKLESQTPIATHIAKPKAEASRYDLEEAAQDMFVNLKRQIDECGYSETLSTYRGIKLDNTAAKIQEIKDGQMDSKAYADIVEMLSIADTYLMILESPEDMFRLGEIV